MIIMFNENPIKRLFINLELKKNCIVRLFYEGLAKKNRILAKIPQKMKIYTYNCRYIVKEKSYRISYRFMYRN